MSIHKANIKKLKQYLSALQPNTDKGKVKHVCNGTPPSK
jgi:hypothetical protein